MNNVFGKFFLFFFPLIHHVLAEPRLVRVDGGNAFPQRVYPQRRNIVINQGSVHKISHGSREAVSSRGPPSAADPRGIIVAPLEGKKVYTRELLMRPPPPKITEEPEINYDDYNPLYEEKKTSPDTVKKVTTASIRLVSPPLQRVVHETAAFFTQPPSRTTLGPLSRQGLNGVSSRLVVPLRRVDRTALQSLQQDVLSTPPSTNRTLSASRSTPIRVALPPAGSALLQQPAILTPTQRFPAEPWQIPPSPKTLSASPSRVPFSQPPSSFLQPFPSSSFSSVPSSPFLPSTSLLSPYPQPRPSYQSEFPSPFFPFSRPLPTPGASVEPPYIPITSAPAALLPQSPNYYQTNERITILNSPARLPSSSSTAVPVALPRQVPFARVREQQPIPLPSASTTYDGRGLSLIKCHLLADFSKYIPQRTAHLPPKPYGSRPMDHPLSLPGQQQQALPSGASVATPAIPRVVFSPSIDSNSIIEKELMMVSLTNSFNRPEVPPIRPLLTPNQKLDLCCRKQGVSPICQSLCNFDTFNDRSLVAAFLTNQCPGPQLGQAYDCASTKVDHTECCARSGLGSIQGGRCMAFCRTHEKTPANVFEYVSCLQVFETIKGCYRDYQYNHPNIFGD